MAKRFTYTICLLGLILLAHADMYAQGKPLKGYIVSLEGDTTRGFIAYLGEAYLSDGIFFSKTEKMKDKKRYTPQDLTAFSILPNVYETIEASVPDDSLSLSKRRFARVVLRGYASLYRLQYPEDKVEVQFYLLKEGQYLLLDNAQERVVETDPVTHIEIERLYLTARYRGVLMTATRGCPDLNSQIESLLFQEAAIAKIVRAYNDCMSTRQSFTYKYKRKRNLDVGLEVYKAYSLTKKNLYGDYQSTGLALSLKLSDSNVSQRIYLYTRLAFYYSNYKYIARFPVSSVGQYSLNVPVCVQVNLAKGLIRPYLYGGFGTSAVRFTRDVRGLKGGFYAVGGGGVQVGLIKVMAQIEKFSGLSEYPNLLAVAGAGIEF